ncbi:fibronectin type III domain-containing protein [Mycoplasma leonicaptivi]|uniref:fibronectin type III domain-containing protein n=1 Tax=Mycoplasma leonicaptivi TaxID=36742 RepID=UPI0004809FB4|nr:fibronectin type III domain-containing protein [Mycoplasma leonicaptivi]
MKKNKNLKKFMLLKSVLVTSFASSFVVAAACGTKTNNRVRVTSFSVSNITENSAKVTLVIRKTDFNNFKIKYKNSNSINVLNGIKKETEVIFELNDLIPGNQYEIQEIFYIDEDNNTNQINLDFFKNQLTFTTKQNQDSAKPNNPSIVPIPNPGSSDKPKDTTPQTPGNTTPSQNLNKKEIVLNAINFSNLLYKQVNATLNFSDSNNEYNNLEITLNNSIKKNLQ